MNLPFLKSAAGDEPVIVEGEFPASPHRLFELWTEPDELLQWFGQKPRTINTAEVDLKVGGIWRFTFGNSDEYVDELTGEYVTVEPGEQLSFTWVHQRTFNDGRVELSLASKVTLSFKASKLGTTIRLVHERIAQEGGRLSVGKGWNGTFTNLINRLAEHREE